MSASAISPTSYGRSAAPPASRLGASVGRPTETARFSKTTWARPSSLALVGNVETVKGIYEMLARGDIPGVLESFSSDAEWRLAEGHPYAPDGRPLFGPEAIAAEFFARAGEEW